MEGRGRLEKGPSTPVPLSAPRTAPIQRVGQGLEEIQHSKEQPAPTTRLVTVMLLEAELDCNREGPGAPGAAALCTFSRARGKSNCNPEASIQGRKERRENSEEWLGGSSIRMTAEKGNDSRQGVQGGHGVKSDQEDLGLA